MVKDPLPQVYSTAAAELSLQVTLTAYGRLFADQFGAETTLGEEAYRSFRERGVSMPVLQRIVHIKGEM